jgi:hypothetical protein
MQKVDPFGNNIKKLKRYHRKPQHHCSWASQLGGNTQFKGMLKIIFLFIIIDASE